MKNLQEKTLQFLSICEGMHQMLKGFHWGAVKHSIHILTDDIDHDILEYQDKIAEIVMGLTGVKYKAGDLKALVSDASDVKTLLNEFENDVLEYKKEVGNDARMSSVHNVIDDILSDVNKWKYLETLS